MCIEVDNIAGFVMWLNSLLSMTWQHLVAETLLPASTLFIIAIRSSLKVNSYDLNSESVWFAFQHLFKLSQILTNNWRGHSPGAIQGIVLHQHGIR